MKSKLHKVLKSLGIASAQTLAVALLIAILYAIIYVSFNLLNLWFNGLVSIVGTVFVLIFSLIFLVNVTQ